MKKLIKAFSLILAILMVISVVVACGDNGKKDDEKKDDGKKEDEKKEEIVDPGFVVTDTFYPQYARNEFEFKDMRTKTKEWFMTSLENDTLFSVAVGDADYAAVSKRWKKDIKTGTDADGNETVEATYTDDAAKLKYVLTATLYKDYPTVDYVITAEYTGAEQSERVHDFYALDSKFTMESDKGYKVHTSKGSLAKADDFELVEAPVAKGGKPVVFAPMQTVDGKTIGTGRSTDGAWPYFDIIGKDCGIMLAIGWTGTWEASFENDKVGEVSFKARQQNFSSVLLPGEKVRTPRIVFTYFDGEAEYGHNVFRKLVVAHYTPKNNDENYFVSPICLNFWGGRTDTFIKNITKLYGENEVKYDATWMDAGWYGDYARPEEASTTANGGFGGSWATELGWYTVNKKLFRTGNLKEIADASHNNKVKLLLWFMIEDGCETISKNLVFGRDAYYPTVVSRNDPNNRIVLRLSDDAVCDKVIDFFKSYMDTQGVDWIRIDNWSREGEAWYYNDIELSHEIDKRFDDLRQGMTENKYILNFYRIWDTLYKEYPGFMLDNCASGGRRMDIEMAMRGVPMWRTDYATSDLEAMQAQTQWLSYWLPFSGTGVVAPNIRSYSYRSLYSSSYSLQSSGLNSENVVTMKTIADELVSLRPYWYGSYYQILEPDNNADGKFGTWNAYELFREDLQKGMLVLIRRQSAQLDSYKIKFKGLQADKNYLVHNIDDKNGAADFTKSGNELMEKGVNITLGAGTIGVYEISLAD